MHFYSKSTVLVQVPHDLPQQRVQTHVLLRLLQEVDEADVVSHQWPQIDNLLQELGEELRAVRVEGLQLLFQSLQHRVLKVLDGLHVHQAWPIFTP